MNLVERVAAAMYETPDPGDDEVFSTWPPTHPEDLAWWLTRAQTAIDTITKEQQNMFIAESSAAYPDVDPEEAGRLVDEARHQGQ